MITLSHSINLFRLKLAILGMMYQSGRTGISWLCMSQALKILAELVTDRLFGLLQVANSHLFFHTNFRLFRHWQTFHTTNVFWLLSDFVIIQQFSCLGDGKMCTCVAVVFLVNFNKTQRKNVFAQLRKFFVINNEIFKIIFSFTCPQYKSISILCTSARGKCILFFFSIFFKLSPKKSPVVREFKIFFSFGFY